MSDSTRATARDLCHQALEAAQPLAWFEHLYSAAAGDASTIPWADLEPNPHLVRWHRRTDFDFTGLRCLKIGCGLGDDCEYLAAHHGFVTGFDVSETAIEWCRQRFPESPVDYVVADLLHPPPQWSRRFQFVQESYTLQVLPPDLRRVAVARIADFVAPGGTLLVVCRGRSDADPKGLMPWPLTQREVESFTEAGLSPVALDDFLDDETPPVRRFVAQFERS